MNKALLLIVACLGTTAVVLSTGRVANPDTATVIPYPEVNNLKRVPIFNDKGIIAHSLTVKIATKVEPQRIVKDVIVPVKMAANKPPQQYSAKKMRQLLLEHQTPSKITLGGFAAPSDHP